MCARPWSQGTRENPGVSLLSARGLGPAGADPAGGPALGPGEGAEAGKPREQAQAPTPSTDRARDRDSGRGVGLSIFEPSLRRGGGRGRADLRVDGRREVAQQPHVVLLAGLHVHHQAGVQVAQLRGLGERLVQVHLPRGGFAAGGPAGPQPGARPQRPAANAPEDGPPEPLCGPARSTSCSPCSPRAR